MVTETATGRVQQPGVLTASCSRAIGTHYYYHRLQYRRIYLNRRTELIIFVLMLNGYLAAISAHPSHCAGLLLLHWEFKLYNNIQILTVLF